MRDIDLSCDLTASRMDNRRLQGSLKIANSARLTSSYDRMHVDSLVHWAAEGGDSSSSFQMRGEAAEHL